VPTVQSRYDDASSKSVKRDIPHSRDGSSRRSIFLKRESLNALVNAYSARPLLSGMASKLPIQPLSLGDLLERDDLVFQVTNNAYSASGNVGGMGSLDVSAQYNASKA